MPSKKLINHQISRGILSILLTLALLITSIAPVWAVEEANPELPAYETSWGTTDDLVDIAPEEIDLNPASTYPGNPINNPAPSNPWSTLDNPVPDYPENPMDNLVPSYTVNPLDNLTPDYWNSLDDNPVENTGNSLDNLTSVYPEDYNTPLPLDLIPKKTALPVLTYRHIWRK